MENWEKIQTIRYIAQYNLFTHTLLSRVGDGDGLYGEQWNLSGDRRVSIVLRD
jgi:hypothetical protein